MQERPAPGRRAIYRIENMDCPTEEALMRKKLGAMPGISGLEFNLIQRILTVHHALPGAEPIEAALIAIGLRPEPFGAEAQRIATPSPVLARGGLTAAGVFAAASELFELLSAWNWHPLGINLNAWSVGGITILEWLPMALAIIAIGIGGLGTYRKGWIALKNFNLNINALMSVAVTGAFIIGNYPEAAMVMVLFNLAEAIEAKSLERARKAIKNLLDLTPEKAIMQSGGFWVETDIREVPVGSVVRVKPGERVAFDGTLVQGQSVVNQAPITGESMPVEKKVGDTVYAGTINESGSFEFRVTAGAGNSTLARIIHAVEEAQASRAPIQNFVDRFARIYTPAVFLTALLVAVIPPLLKAGGWPEWIYTALVLLVIGCPCALVISTPISIVSGMAAATRHGILVKGGIFLERGRKLRYLALDKTGTITHGKPGLTDFVELDGAGKFDRLALAAGLAARSDHPVSRAIAESAAEKGLTLPEVLDFTAIPGLGVHGVIDGKKWYLGSRRMLEELTNCPLWLGERILELEKQGKSVVVLLGDAGAQALFAVADTVKQTSLEAIRELKKFGIQTMMLTGDNEYTARAIAEQVGVDSFKGNLMPEDKLAVIEQLAQNGTIGMVGDGINDAPALAGADIGFAMAAAGSDTAIETADVALMDNDLRKIPRFISLSRSTYAVLRQNIILALGVKAFFFALACMGQASMWMAVCADVGACLLVVANGLRAMRQ